MKHKQEFARMGSGSWQCWTLWGVAAALLMSAAFYCDAAVFAWTTQHQVPTLRAFMKGVSRWGDWPSHIAVGVVVAVIAYSLGQRRWLTIIVAMLLACAVAGSVNRIIKIAAGRARPTVESDVGWNGPRFSSKYNSFPSGHTASSTAFFATLFFARKRLGASLLAIPLLIATSRIYIGAHHLSDVVFAAILGALIAFCIWQLAERRIAISG